MGHIWEKIVLSIVDVSKHIYATAKGYSCPLSRMGQREEAVPCSVFTMQRREHRQSSRDAGEFSNTNWAPILQYGCLSLLFTRLVRERGKYNISALFGSID